MLSFSGHKNLDKTAITRIIHFIDDLPLRTGDLKLPGIDIQTYWRLISYLENSDRVGGNIADGVRYNYNERAQVFTLKCMPTAIHDTIQSFMISEFGKMYKSGFITNVEFELLSLHIGADDFLPSGNGQYQKSGGAKKGSGVRKQADVSFSYGSDDTEFEPSAFPLLVIEVGFTESYLDLLEDAREWLEKSRGEVQLVVIIKLDEENKPTKPGMNSTREEDNYRHVETSDGSDVEKNEPVSSQVTKSFGSDPASYQDLRRSCKADEWVGTINWFLESWRYEKESGKMKQDGERIILLPAPNNGGMFQITKADLKGIHSSAKDEEQTYTLGLDNYRERLTKARRQLAYSRMVCHLKGLRKWKRIESGDSDSDKSFKEDEGDEDAEDEEGEEVIGIVRRKIARVGVSAP